MNPAPSWNSKHFKICRAYSQLKLRMKNSLNKAKALNKREGAG